MSQKSVAGNQGPQSRARGLLFFLLLLAGVLGILFWRCFDPASVLFANDGPLGQIMADHARVPGTLTGSWSDLNSYGARDTGAMPDLTFALLWLLGPLGFSKFYALFTLLFLGACVWCFCRQLGLGSLAAILGGLAATLSSDFFGVSCWGVGSQTLCFGLNYLALAAVVSPLPLRAWLRYPLAGLAVGLGVTEAFDIGAIFSLFTAAFVLFHALAEGGSWVRRSVQGGLRLATLAIFAGFIAAAALSILIGTQVKGVVGMAQDAETRAQRWDQATQWSLPKREMLGIVVPGLFGARMDTPEGGNYWGAVGRDPAWDRYFASGKQGSPPDPRVHYIRYGGGGGYAGVLVVITALWAVLQSFRRKDSVFSPAQCKFIWFWTGVAGVSLLLAFGRFAPFFQLFYALPYASTIRNPAKFMHVWQWALVVIFAYGVYGLRRRYLAAPAVAARSAISQLQAWWAKAVGFDRQWAVGSLLALAGSVLGWLVYAASKTKLVSYLQEVQFDEAMANAIAAFSFRQVGVFVLILAFSLGLFALVLSGYFSGRRARAGAILLGLLLVVDLARVDLRWIVTYDWHVKYESNSIIEFLRARPYEQRVTIFPLDRYVDLRRLPREMMPLAYQYQNLAQLYSLEWMQHLFPYYNIQSLDIVQEPRVATDKAAFEAVMAFSPLRRWELTNTRYLVGVAPLLDLFNQQVDPAQKRLRVAVRFDLAAKPGAGGSPGLEQITAALNTNGQFAVFDFTGALPRVKLYSNWKVSTNEPAKLQDWVKEIQSRLPAEMSSALTAQSTTDLATLKELADPAFDPAQTVLLAEPLASPTGTNQNAGEVKFESYAPKRIVLRASNPSPAVLLLNDKYDPNWQVSVDGQPAKLLRCNFMVRGVYLGQPGEHRVEFKFQPSVTSLYVSLVAVGVGVVLLFLVGFARRGAAAVEPAAPAAVPPRK